jgi:hypothetical protein
MASISSLTITKNNRFKYFEKKDNRLIFSLPLKTDDINKLDEDLFLWNWKTREDFANQATSIRILADHIEYEEKKGLDCPISNVLKKHTDFSGIEGSCLILRILAFYIEHAYLKNVIYLNRFLEKGKVKSKYKIFLEQETENHYLVVDVDYNYFLEHFVFFMIKRFAKNCRWIKQNGMLGPVYKHHLVIFNEWIAVEQHTLKKVNLQIVKDFNMKGRTVVEYNEKCGADIATVFTRAISRVVYADEMPYLFFRNNCEHFGRFCLYGSPGSSQVTLLILALVSYNLYMLTYQGGATLHFVWGFVAVVLLLEYLSLILWRFQIFSDKNQFLRIILAINPWAYITSYKSFPK